MNSNYRYIFSKVFIFITILFFIDLLLGNILNFFYFKQSSGLQYSATYSIEKTKAEMIIMGSSRANHHYDPRVLKKRLGISCYNTGRDGQYIFYQYALLQTILKRYSPKIIILDFVDQEFEFDQRDYERLSSLLPYYKNHPEIRSTIELKSPYEKIKLLSKIYPFNSSLLTIVIGNTKFNSNRRSIIDFDGFVPLDRKCKEPIKTMNDLRKIIIDNNKVKIFELFIQDCLKSKVNLYIVCSPYYINYKSTSSSIILGKKIAAKYNIDFYDFSQEPAFITNQSLFDDPYHLNDDGAKIFSDSITDRLVKKNIN